MLSFTCINVVILVPLIFVSIYLKYSSKVILENPGGVLLEKTSKVLIDSIGDQYIISQGS